MSKEENALHWNAVCTVDDIVPNTGICALVQNRHVAVFHVPGANDQIYAIDNVDPNVQASVLARGLIGSVGDRVVVASPIYKHRFDLKTGECLEAPEKSVQAYQVRIENRTVWIAA
ncbi:MAG TPA: nitrite reductase small subunit NirD [Noviherbaspirillum sp.]